MDTKPYTLIIEKLNNENDLINLVKETEECFYLDYKQGEKDDYSQSRSIKGPDLDNIAKSISGFGNALGGILIFGVDKHKNLKREKLHHQEHQVELNNFEHIVCFVLHYYLL